MSETELNFGAKVGLPGWRLHLLELVNWGTFGGDRIHSLAPEGGWSLLVGENGSGKSTAIDALRTLLAPRTLLRGSFNDAAGGQNRKDRTLASYIRGQWSASRDDETSDTSPQFLRGEDTPSFLLAVFTNAVTGTSLTLSQILWVSGGTDHTKFLVAPSIKGISGDLQALGSGREMAKKLRERGFHVYDGYAGYARDFLQKMGVPGEGAMEIFNQAIGVKEVVSVKQFLRTHLLARGEVVDKIRDSVIPRFSNLEDCWNSIQRDKLQLQLLAPIVLAHQRASEATSIKSLLDHLQEIASAHYDRIHWELLDRFIRQRIEELDLLHARIQETANTLEREQQTLRAYEFALAQHHHSTRIAQLENEIHRLELDMRDIKKTRAEFDHATSLYQLSAHSTDEATFLHIRERAAQKITELETAVREQTRAAETAGVAARTLEAEQTAIEIAIESIRQRRALVDADLQNVRDLICRETGLTAESLPFAGELIEVKPEHENWHGAIERLMHGLGVSLLVPEKHYREVAALINRSRLADTRGRGLRLTFHRVPTNVTDAPPTAAETVPACLNYKEEHPLTRWLIADVNRSFPHRCCQDIAEMESHHFGLTREGLIRGGSRHIKDDRKSLNDRTTYVLGWSPEKKLQALATKLEHITAEMARARSHERTSRTAATTAQQGINLLTALREIKSFSRIDLSGGLAHIATLKSEKTDIESKSDDRKILQQKLETAQSSVAMWTARDREERAAHTRIDEAIKSDQQNKQRLERDIPPNAELPDEAGIARLSEIEGDSKPTLETIATTKKSVLDTLRNRSGQQQRTINEARIAMGAPMQNFLTSFPEERKDLKAEADYAEDFVRIHDRVSNDDLPAHEERFRSFLNDNLTQNIAALDAELASEVKLHRERIAQVNFALKKLDYSGNSYVEIHIRERGEQNITRFKGRLREILGMGMTESEEARLGLFTKIRELIEDFKKPEWTREVADGRNWLDFGIRERRRIDDAEIDYFDSSQGKSGGQKAKLAFTLLAASLCAQYGLADNPSTTQGFRLVVIDEIFARTDEANSRRALDLFKSMGLQLILAAPWEAKVKIAESYVESYHLSVNPAHNASSIHRATREAYETARHELSR